MSDLTPQSYGAVGDGICDDTEALQKLLDCSLYIKLGCPANVYRITCSLTLRNGHMIQGNGATIKQTSPQTVMFDCVGMSDITISGGVFVGLKEVPYINSPSSRAICIDAASATNIKVNANKFIDWCYSPIMSNLPLSGCYFTDNIVIGPGAGVLSDVNYRNTSGATLIGTDIYVSRNKITATAQGLIVGQGSVNVTVTGNIIHDTINEHGMYIDTGVRSVSITGNVIRNTGVNGNGIKVQHYDSFGLSPESISITGNSIVNVGAHGILVINTSTGIGGLYAQAVTITGNSIYTVGGNGIDARYIRNGTVSGNTIDSCNYFGINVSRSQSLVVNNNSVRMTQQCGIFDDGTSGDIAYNSNLVVLAGMAGNSNNGLSTGIFIASGTEYSIQNNIVRGDPTKMQYGLWVVGGDQSSIDVRGNTLTGAKDYGARFAGTPLRYFGENVLRGLLGNDRGYNIPESLQRGSEENLYFGTHFPTSGSWPQGAKVISRYPLASGFVGWVCVVGGSPGTWRTYGPVTS